MSGVYSKGCITLALIAAAIPARAYNTTLIRFDGPEIHGDVNTLTNTFVVTSWVENSGGDHWWSPAPASLPLHYTALDSSGAVFDVPDNWDGHMNGWAFISDLSNPAILWNEGAFTAFAGHHGWGGDKTDLGEVQIFGSQPEMFWQNTPVGANGIGGFRFDIVSTIPEPSSTAMCLIAGAISICSFGRRRKDE
jgi:hypothetical protein